jgi:hypothetical protein
MLLQAQMCGMEYDAMLSAVGRLLNTLVRVDYGQRFHLALDVAADDQPDLPPAQRTLTITLAPELLGTFRARYAGDWLDQLRKGVERHARLYEI